MDLKRFFVSDKINGEFITLSGEEFYHAVKVTRHKIGYKIIVCDNQDKDYYCTITNIEKDFLTAKIDEIKNNEAETKVEICLCIGINKDMDTAVQKAVELGVNKIYPMLTQHGNIDKVNSDRLNKIILESAKQCGRSRLTVLEKTIDYYDALIVAKATNTFLFYEFENENKVAFAKDICDGKINIIIGSEGGFCEEEIKSAHRIGIKTFTLGKRILRVCTALVSAITLVLEKCGE